MDYKIITYQKDNGDYIAYYKHLPLLQTGIIFFSERLPAMASTGMIIPKRPTIIPIPSIILT